MCARPSSAEDQRTSWLALLHAPGLGALTSARLIDHFGDAAAVLAATDAELARLGVSEVARDALRHPDREAVESDLSWLEGPGCSLLTLADDDYPVLLRSIPDPPLVLFVQGRRELLGSVQLAVVGSRNPTPGGAQTARDFAARLTRCGLTITSGLALGIDAAAHAGALAAGGRTIAVAGTGLDRVYPARHRELAHEIASRGALVSEFATGTPAVPGNFPRRNRVIAGLSTGTLVVEAALRSGSLISARHALEQGREVFAVPGSIHNPLARGCHALIREGAKLVESIEDILEELAPLLGVAVQTQPDAGPIAGAELDAEYAALLEAMGHDPVAVDVLVERSGLTANVVSSMLLVLELHGHVASQPGGIYVRQRTKGMK